jgi:hypothetical protein
MPKLRNMLGETGTIDIPVDGDDALRVTYRRGIMTPRMQARMALFQDVQHGDTARAAEALAFFCTVYAGLIESWNLTDDDGAPLATDAETLSDVPLDVLTLVAREIGRATSPDPLRESGSSNGSSRTGASEPLPIGTAS